MQTVRVCLRSPSSQSRSGERSKIIQRWVDSMSSLEVGELIIALYSRTAGDWLEAHGLPRSWRKQLTIVTVCDRQDSEHLEMIEDRLQGV